MTNVIALRPRRKDTARIDEAHGGAEILLFMGVRYIRDEPPAEDPRPVPTAPEPCKRRMSTKTARARLKA